MSEVRKGGGEAVRTADAKRIAKAIVAAHLYDEEECRIITALSAEYPRTQWRKHIERAAVEQFARRERLANGLRQWLGGPKPATLHQLDAVAKETFVSTSLHGIGLRGLVGEVKR